MERGKKLTNNPQKVLLVEDNLADAELTKISFRELQIPYELVHLNNGQELLFYLQTADLEEIIFILLDFNMPKVNGLDVLRAFQKNNNFRKIPVIVFSSSLQEKDIEHCYQLGANAYVNKPMNLSHFDKTIQTIVAFWAEVNVRPIFT